MSAGVAGDFDPAAAAQVLRERITVEPRVLLVLGSGLGPLAESVQDHVIVPFEAVGGLPSVGVAGHAGRWIAGHLEGEQVLVQSGRFHFYEGHGAEVVGAPVRIAQRLGVDTVILTNAAGGIAKELDPGSIMLIDDHLDFLHRGPLAGPVQAGEARFPDMSAPYDPLLQRLALEAALELGIQLTRGTYAALLGPSYETPAEIRMLERLGVQAVGMSTVPEVIVARALGVRALAFSLITNKAAGLGQGTLGHDEVVEVGRAAAGSLEALVRGVMRRLAP
jgi:purine-nucleoside phosphorylase